MRLLLGHPSPFLECGLVHFMDACLRIWLSGYLRAGNLGVHEAALQYAQGITHLSRSFEVDLISFFWEAMGFATVDSPTMRTLSQNGRSPT